MHWTGAIGSIARYQVSILMAGVSHSLPWGTIFVNISGSFMIAFFGALTLAQPRFPVAENMRLSVMAGFCGGFNTFSSFSLQNLELIRQGALSRALVNIMLSVILCLAATALGHYISTAGRLPLSRLKSRKMPDCSKSFFLPLKNDGQRFMVPASGWHCTRDDNCALHLSAGESAAAPPKGKSPEISQA